MVYAAFLRGINVGGNNKLPMKELKRLFEEAGCENVTTYIQSGNVVFTAQPEVAAEIPAKVSAAILEQLGLKVPVVVRSLSSMRALATGNPYLKEGETENLHVLFLADSPAEGQIANLDPLKGAPDRFAVKGEEVYLHLPGGVGNSKLTNAYFDSRLKTMGTGRNWRTTLTILEMMEALAAGLGQK